MQCQAIIVLVIIWANQGCALWQRYGPKIQGNVDGGFKQLERSIGLCEIAGRSKGDDEKKALIMYI